jgi:hypothetical protein
MQIKTYRTINVPGDLYEHESWSLTVREEHRPRAFKNRVLRRILEGVLA